MGTHIPGVTAAVLIGIIFKVEAYWLPRDRYVTMRLYSVNDPPGRNPTPRSYRVNQNSISTVFLAYQMNVMAGQVLSYVLIGL